MLMCSLKFLILTSFAGGVVFSNVNFTEELNAIKDLVNEGNGVNIGNFTPTTSSIDIKSLKKLAETLQPLKSKSRKRRQDYDTYAQDMSNDQVDSDIDTALKTVELPLSKGGHSAFSIKADTVYILYPSLFQDPNIFGRFSIPQNVNMDPSKEERMPVIENTAAPKVQPPPVRNFQPEQNFPSNHLPFYPRNRRSSALNPYEQNYANDEASVGNQQNDYNEEQEEYQQQQAENQKRNVETHLSGTIVVLNQDVNENNAKESY